MISGLGRAMPDILATLVNIALRAVIIVRTGQIILHKGIVHLLSWNDANSWMKVQ